MLIYPPDIFSVDSCYRCTECRLRDLVLPFDVILEVATVNIGTYKNGVFSPTYVAY
jgi:hypothetical protein